MNPFFLLPPVDTEERTDYIAVFQTFTQARSYSEGEGDATIITTGWVRQGAQLTALATAWAELVNGAHLRASAGDDDLTPQGYALLLIEDAARIDIFSSGRRPTRNVARLAQYTRAEHRFARRWADARASIGGKNQFVFRMPVDCRDFTPPIANHSALNIAYSLVRYLAPGVRIHLYPAPSA